MALIIVQSSMRRHEGQLSDTVLRQHDSGELQYTIMNGFDVPITILGVTLEDAPTSNLKLGARDIPPHDALQPGQSLTASVRVGTGECALQRYVFKVKVRYMFAPPPPVVGELQFAVVRER